MNKQFVRPELLQKADKILFITHLALGDFTYLQNYFVAFASQYPHIKIHIWVDEVRRTRCFWRWKYLKKYALYDWLATCPFVEKVYTQTYSPALFRKSTHEAQQEKYPLVVSLATLRSHRYARLARAISPQGFVVGMRQNTRGFNFVKKWSYKKLNASLLPHQISGAHVSDCYALWFELIFGVVGATDKRVPFIAIPNKWIIFAKLRFLKWGIDKKSKKFGRVIFINPYAKTPKRSWPLESVATLIRSLKQQDTWGDISFVVNIVPEEFTRAQKFFNKHSLGNTFLFTANHNFFQLPAVMSLCDLIISVETSIMHFASALHVPVIALMRQKNPEWAPIDKELSVVITTAQRKDWVCDISVARVMQDLDTIFPDLFSDRFGDECSINKAINYLAK